MFCNYTVLRFLKTTTAAIPERRHAVVAPAMPESPVFTGLFLPLSLPDVGGVTGFESSFAIACVSLAPHTLQALSFIPSVLEVGSFVVFQSPQVCPAALITFVSVACV